MLTAVDSTFVIAKKGPSLVEPTLKAMFTTKRPERLSGNKAHGSDPPDEKLAKHGVEWTAPHRSNRKKRRRRMVAN